MNQDLKQAIVLMGPSGAGKSVQADYLVSRHAGWMRLSSGDLLRADSSVAACLASGELVPSSEVERVIAQALEANDSAAMIILDGFPRTLDQAAWLDRALSDRQRPLVAVVHLDLPLEVARQRLALRQRSDDGVDALAVKWREYQVKTVPVLSYYERQGIVINVNGAATRVRVGRTIEESLHV